MKNNTFYNHVLWYQTKTSRTNGKRNGKILLVQYSLNLSRLVFLDDQEPPPAQTKTLQGCKGQKPSPKQLIFFKAQIHFQDPVSLFYFPSS